ncbi:MAG TPA: chromosomal replication initiator protein DnaA [Trueperaceae bacterium]|nr:chromosomal replication initiator protein DnaA [Trueperaceae bacterium]
MNRSTEPLTLGEGTTVSGAEHGIWNDILQSVRGQIPEVEFRTWFEQVRPVGFDDGAFVIGVPHTFARDWLRNNYTEVLEAALRDIGARTARVAFRVVGAQNTEQQDLFSASSRSSSAAVGGNGDPTHARNDRSAPQDLSGSAQYGPPESPARGERKLPHLNPKYVFANFVVGPNNHLANAAAQAVAESPGQTYNPLFLYGESGLGKTHLMHAVGHAVLERHPSLSVEYVTTETFTNNLVDAIQGKKMTQFRDRYRSIDLLLIDDIQFIGGKERTQEEFFHTFNALYESGKQLIVSSDSPPKDIPKLEKRLRSRFEWGLITDVQPPDLETRMAILQMNAAYRGVKVPGEVIDYISRHVTSNIRELEGALVRAIVYTSMNQVPLNRQTVAKALSDVFASSDINLSMADILATTAKAFNIDPDDVRGKGRRQELVVPRQIAMYLIRELTAHSYPEIGQYFSGRDHSTVMYAVQKVTAALEQESDLTRAVRNLKDSLV